jgi:hypothetical protein
MRLTFSICLVVPTAGRDHDQGRCRDDSPIRAFNSKPKIIGLSLFLFVYWETRRQANKLTMLRVFRWWNVSVPRSWHRLAENVADSVGAFVEGTVYFIGPLLILLALGIASLLTFTWCTVLVPMWLDKYRSDDINSTTEPSQELVTTGRLVSFFPLKLGMAWGVGLHAMVVLTLLGNVMFNYWHCVRTKHVGPEYDAVVRELAAATSFPFPETPEQVMAFKRDFEDLMVLRMRRRRERAMEQQNKQEMQQQQQQETLSTTVAVPLGNGSVQHRRPADSSSASGNSGAFAALLPSPPPHDAQSLMANYPSSQLLQQQLPSVIPAVTATQAPTAAQAPVVRRWMLLGPYEWGYCGNSRQPKPPRSHYDHVSRNLVLNLDHYCPWMFNSSTFPMSRFCFFVSSWEGWLDGCCYLVAVPFFSSFLACFAHVSTYPTRCAHAQIVATISLSVPSLVLSFIRSRVLQLPVLCVLFVLRIPEHGVRYVVVGLVTLPIAVPLIA